MKDLGAASKILGIEIKWDRNKNTCSYLKVILKESVGQVWNV